MANKKKLPKLSKRVENVENWLAQVTDNYNVAIMQVNDINDGLADTQDRLNTLEKGNKKTNAEIDKLRALVSTVNKRAGFITTQQKQPTYNATGSNPIATLTNSLNLISLSMVKLNATVAKSLSGKGAAAFGAVPELAPTAATTAPDSKRDKDKEPTAFGLLKSLFTNPAVVAALAGIVYFVLPKEIQEKVKGTLGAFVTGIEQGLGQNESEGLKGFNTAIKATGVAFATYLGAKMIANIAEAITISLKLVKMLGGGKLGKGAAVAAGLAIGGTALAARKMGEAETAEEPPLTTTPARSEQEYAPTPAANGNIGIKPSAGGIGIKPPPETIKSVISEAAKRVGVDENIMMAVAKQESGFDPNASARGSSAKGLFQFIDATWNSMVSRYGDKYPELARGPFDPLASALAGALYIKENAAILQKQGIPVNGTNLYALHFLGPGGGPKLLKADPGSIAADIFPEAAASNKGVFYTKDGQPKTVAEVMNFLYGKVGAVAEAYASGKGSTITAATSTPSTSGEQVSTLSYGIKVAATPTQTASVNNVDNSTVASTQKTKGDENFIPSPIAARGSLIAFTKHTTAYV